MRCLLLLLFSFFIQLKADCQSWGDSTLKTQRIFYKTEVEPKFIGGEKGLYKFLKEASNLPISEKPLSTNLVVIANLIITKEGKVAYAEIVKGINDKYNNQVIELVKKMPAWTPAYQNNYPVPIYITLPFTFKE